MNVLNENSNKLFNHRLLALYIENGSELLFRSRKMFPIFIKISSDDSLDDIKVILKCKCLPCLNIPPKDVILFSKEVYLSPLKIGSIIYSLILVEERSEKLKHKFASSGGWSGFEYTPWTKLKLLRYNNLVNNGFLSLYENCN